MLSDICLSVAYIRPNSRTERPRKTKIGTEVTHITRDTDTTFKVKGQGHRGREHIVAGFRLQLVNIIHARIVEVVMGSRLNLFVCMYLCMFWHHNSEHEAGVSECGMRDTPVWK